MQSFKSFIKEKRSHADINVKTSAWTVLNHYNDIDSGNEWFVTFLSVPMFKVTNPKSVWGTPSGNYSYSIPLSFEHYDVGNYDQPLDKIFPFASHQPFMCVFNLKPESRITYLSQYDNYDTDVKRLKHICQEVYKINSIDALIHRAENTVGEVYNKPTSFSKLWNLTRLISKYILEHRVNVSGKSYKEFDGQVDKDINKYQHNIPRRVSFIWSKLLRQLGYEVLIDDEAQSLIDLNEKHQVLVLDVKCIDKKDMYENKWLDYSDKILDHLSNYYDISDLDRMKIVHEPWKFKALLELTHDEGELQHMTIDFDGKITVDGENVSI